MISSRKSSRAPADRRAARSSRRRCAASRSLRGARSRPRSAPDAVPSAGRTATQACGSDGLASRSHSRKRFSTPSPALGLLPERQPRLPRGFAAPSSPLRWSRCLLQNETSVICPEKAPDGRLARNGRRGEPPKALQLAWPTLRQVRVVALMLLRLRFIARMPHLSRGALPLRIGP